MLTKNEVKIIQEELDTAKNPLFFYDDDPDGLCSFLLLYRVHRLGKGIIVKAAPKVDAKFLRKVTENNPEKIFILDIPIVEQDFVDEAKKPIFWIDHHDPLKVKKVNFKNPQGSYCCSFGYISLYVCGIYKRSGKNWSCQSIFLGIRR